MRIRTLRANGWRNLAPLQLSFEPAARLHVLHGDNGQGKTNVIEALYYLATFRSFRTTRAADLVARGAPAARIAVEVDTAELTRSVEVVLQPAGAVGPAMALADEAGVAQAGAAEGPGGVRTHTRTEVREDRGPAGTVVGAHGGSAVEPHGGSALGPHSGTVVGAHGGTAVGPVTLSDIRAVSRTIAVDGKSIRGVSAAFGVVPVVLFVPEDLLLVRAPPSARRRFVDMAVGAVEPAYFAEAATFQKVLRSRNALLRAGRGVPSPALLDTYDEQLARAGARVVQRRRRLVAALAPGVQHNFSALHAALPVELRYTSDETVPAAGAEADVAAALLRGLNRRRSIDERRGHTTFGPQTDDLEIDLGGRPAREHASQGQLRSLVLAMKLAELAHVESRRGETPALLLDDVPSELDPRRRTYLFETLGALTCQTVVSVADLNTMPAVEGRAIIRVENGRLEPGSTRG